MFLAYSHPVCCLQSCRDFNHLAYTHRTYAALTSRCVLNSQTVSVGLVGVGMIGNSLLRMLVEQREVLRTQFGLDLQIRAVANGDKVEEATLLYTLMFVAESVREGKFPLSQASHYERRSSY